MELPTWAQRPCAGLVCSLKNSGRNCSLSLPGQLPPRGWGAEHLVAVLWMAPRLSILVDRSFGVGTVFICALQMKKLDTGKLSLPESGRAGIAEKHEVGARTVSLGEWVRTREGTNTGAETALCSVAESLFASNQSPDFHPRKEDAACGSGGHRFFQKLNYF